MFKELSIYIGYDQNQTTSSFLPSHRSSIEHGWSFYYMCERVRTYRTCDNLERGTTPSISSFRLEICMGEFLIKEHFGDD